jgi:hypothetical protein
MKNHWLSHPNWLLKNRHSSHFLLVGGIPTAPKNMKVNGKDYPVYEMENNKCLRPPTSFGVQVPF